MIDIVAAHAFAIENFMKAFYEARKATIEDTRKLRLEPQTISIPSVKDKCPNCSAPNSDYKLNCDYCNSPLLIIER